MPFSGTLPQDGIHPWKQKSQMASLKQKNHYLAPSGTLPNDMPQNSALPNGFLPLQPVSTTEVRTLTNMLHAYGCVYAVIQTSYPSSIGA